MEGERFGSLFLGLVILVLAAPGVVLANADVWKDPVSGSFGDNDRWQDGSAPTATGGAAFNAAGAYDILFDYDPLNQFLSVFGTGVDVTFAGDGGPRLYSVTTDDSQSIQISSGSNLTLGMPGAPIDVVAGKRLTIMGDSGLYVYQGSEISVDYLLVGSLNSDDTIHVSGSGSGLTARSPLALSRTATPAAWFG